MRPTTLSFAAFQLILETSARIPRSNPARGRLLDSLIHAAGLIDIVNDRGVMACFHVVGQLLDVVRATERIDDLVEFRFFS